jgi:Protein of unknown function (DUF559)
VRRFYAASETRSVKRPLLYVCEGSDNGGEDFPEDGPGSGPHPLSRLEALSREVSFWSMTEDNEWIPPTTIYEKMIAERLMGLGFVPQDGRQCVCGYYPDFVNFKTKKIVEICGPNTTSYGPQRTATLLNAGWRIYRIPNDVVDLWKRRRKYRDLVPIAPGVFRRKKRGDE